MTAQQISASANQQIQLQQALAGTLQQQLAQPLGAVAEGFRDIKAQQGEHLSRGLGDSMAAFADKLDALLGGQVGQAKDLQAQTLQVLGALEQSLKNMVAQVGSAGESAAANMAEQMAKSAQQAEARQAALSDVVRSLAEDMRAATTRSQAETASGVTRLIEDLGNRMSTVVDALEGQSRSSGLEQQRALTDMTLGMREGMQAMQAAFARTQEGSAEAVGRLLGAMQQDVRTVVETLQVQTRTIGEESHRRTSDLASAATTAIEQLAAGVTAQTAAIAQATDAMRIGVGAMDGSVQRNVAEMGRGANEMRAAAERFTQTGSTLGEVLEHSQALSQELTRSASLLKASSEDVLKVVGDYRDAREQFASLISTLQGTVDTAKRDAGMTSDLVRKLEAAAGKLGEAKGQADLYLGKLNEVMAEANSQFLIQMLKTLAENNGQFQKHLETTTNQMVGTLNDLDSSFEELDERLRATFGAKR